MARPERSAGVLAGFARDRWRVALLALLAVHLHVLCDLAGSRGPGANDFWPIYYLSPLRGRPMWVWRGQWSLDGWQNHVINAALLGWSLCLAPSVGYSFFGPFSADVLMSGSWEGTPRLARQVLSKNSVSVQGGGKEKPSRKRAPHFHKVSRRQGIRDDRPLLDRLNGAGPQHDGGRERAGSV